MKVIVNSNRMICYFDDVSQVPLGVAEIKKENGNLWLMFVLIGRSTPHGSGTHFVRKILSKFKDKTFYLRTRFNNYAMINCALKAGMIFKGTNDFGFVFINKSQKCGIKKGSK